LPDRFILQLWMLDGAERRHYLAKRWLRGWHKISLGATGRSLSRGDLLPFGSATRDNAFSGEFMTTSSLGISALGRMNDFPHDECYALAMPKPASPAPTADRCRLAPEPRASAQANQRPPSPQSVNLYIRDLHRAHSTSPSRLPRAERLEPMRYQKVRRHALRTSLAECPEQKKRGAGGLAPARALAACGLGRGIGRYNLLTNAGVAACRAEGYGGTPQRAHHQ
jgi:hypothetical protein